MSVVNCVEVKSDINDSINQVVSDDLVNEIINCLQELNFEYDCLLKETEGENDLDDCETPLTAEKKDGQYYVHEIVKNSISVKNMHMKRWQEKELAVKYIDLQYQRRICNKERQELERKTENMERRLTMETKKMEILNKQIAGIKIEEGSQYLELQKVMSELEKMMVTESIHPANILKVQSNLTELQDRIEILNKDLLKYADFPPDISEAKAKLAKAKLEDIQLQKCIRNLLCK